MKQIILRKIIKSLNELIFTIYIIKVVKDKLLKTTTTTTKPKTGAGPGYYTGKSTKNLWNRQTLSATVCGSIGNYGTPTRLMGTSFNCHDGKC
jgi:hypothetical protein